MLTQQAFDAKEREARELGAERGRIEASWLDIDDSNAAAILQGIEDGDPAIMDGLPSAPLSGLWADDPTPRSVLAELGALSATDADQDALLTAYEDAFSMAVQDEVQRRARYYTED